jgi:hypothetical protein
VGFCSARRLTRLLCQNFDQVPPAVLILEFTSEHQINIFHGITWILVLAFSPHVLPELDARRVAVGCRR